MHRSTTSNSAMLNPAMIKPRSGNLRVLSEVTERSGSKRARTANCTDNYFHAFYFKLLSTTTEKWIRFCVNHAEESKLCNSVVEAIISQPEQTQNRCSAGGRRAARARGRSSFFIYPMGFTRPHPLAPFQGVPVLCMEIGEGTPHVLRPHILFSQVSSRHRDAHAADQSSLLALFS